MTEQAVFHAAIIENSARMLAAHAAELLIERCPTASAFGDPAFNRWQDHLAGRLHELGGAMRAGEPDLFGARLHWARLAFQARGLDADELTACVDALSETLAEHLPPGGPAAVAPFIESARAWLARPAAEPPPNITGPHGELAARHLAAILDGDRRAAIGALTDAMDHGLPARDALLHVMIPVSREIGRMWHLGEIAIAEEHFTTATAQLLMGVIRERLTMRPANGRAVLIASVPGNKHELAGRIAGLLLESAGWRVIDLGTEMPASDLVRAAGDFGADLIVLGVMLATQVEAARVTMHALRSDPRTASIPVIVGGHVFDDAPQLWKKMGANAHARTVGHVVDLADSVLKGALNDPDKDGPHG